MGKASKWFKALLGFKKNNDSSSSTMKKWSDVKSYRDDDFDHYLDDKSHNYYGVSMLVHDKNDVGVDPTKGVGVHSNVVMTSSIRTTAVTTWNSEEWAAVVIQSHFRAYLESFTRIEGTCEASSTSKRSYSEEANRGYAEAYAALIRAQSRALAGRSHVFESPPFSAKSTQFLHHGPTTPDKFEQILRARSMKNDQMFMLKRNSSKHMGNANAKQRNLFHSSELILSSDQFSFSYDETCYSSVDNSPQLHSTASSRCARSRTGPFTPTKSTNGTQSYTSDQYSNNHPNYMSYTEAAKAKTRSTSAPKLRPQYDKRYSRSNIQKGSKFYANFTSKGTYQGSGTLDKIGMPVRGCSDEFNRDFCHIY